MRTIGLAFLLVLLASLPSRAQECLPPARCVSDRDLQTLLPVLLEKRCLATTDPTVTVTVDRYGRVAGPSAKPYGAHLDWCGYEVDVESQIHVDAELPQEPKWGFRLRLKAAFGLLTRDLVEGRKFLDSGDVGLMVEPFHFYLATLNAFISLRSVGVGIGHDVTETFGVGLLCNTTWESWRVNPFLALYFAF